MPDTLPTTTITPPTSDAEQLPNLDRRNIESILHQGIFPDCEQSRREKAAALIIDRNPEVRETAYQYLLGDQSPYFEISPEVSFMIADAFNVIPAHHHAKMIELINRSPNRHDPLILESVCELAKNSQDPELHRQATLLLTT